MVLLIVLAILLVLAVTVILGMVWTAFIAGLVNSWLFEGNFSDGWSMAWDHPWRLLAIWLIGAFFTGISSARNYSRK